MKKAIARTDRISKEDFISIRRHFLGGSDSGAVCGVNPYKSALDVWLEKTGRTSGGIEDNEKMFWGRALEGSIRDSFQTFSGLKAEPVNMMFTHTEADFLLATPDAIVRENDGSVSVLEIKTTSAYNSDAWADGNIPASYFMQVQKYLYVLELSKGYICCLIGGQKFVWYPVPREDEIIAAMLSIEKNFWYEHVLKDVPPEVTENSANGLTQLYPKSNGTSILLSEEADRLISEHQELKNVSKEIQKGIDLCENRLKALLGNSECGRTPSGYSVNWRNATSNRLDGSRLKKERPDVYSEYLSTTQCRRFSLSEPKGMTVEQESTKAS